MGSFEAEMGCGKSRFMTKVCFGEIFHNLSDI